jgi:23S rRNA (uracil1939-C5)-methyltransferase
MVGVEEIVEGEITSIAFGGEGIMRVAGFVVFVPFTCIGEMVRARVVSLHRSYAKGALLDVLTPSSMRQQALCPYFGTCGGCQFQHLKMSAQLEVKQQLLYEALTRIGGIENVSVMQVAESACSWEYRRHITLQLEAREASGTGFRAFYVATDNTSLISINECPIFECRSSPLWGAFNRLLADISNQGNIKGRVSLFKRGQHRWVCHFLFEKAPPDFSSTMLKALASDSPIGGVILSLPSGVQHFGMTDIPFAIDQYQFTASPLAFVQNHPEQSAAIYRHICRLAMELEISNALDLYCGIGVTSIMLKKKGINVIGVEYGKEAVNLAMVNAIQNDASIRFIQGDVEKLIKNLLKDKPQLAIINPPRKGLTPGVIKHIRENPPKHLIYISCMPATLARDLKSLNPTYAVAGVQPYDMFPQTTHLETVVHLKLRVF